MAFDIALRNPGSGFDISLSGAALQTITTSAPSSATTFFHATVTGGGTPIYSRDFESSSSEYGEVSSAIVASPFTIAAWIKVESLGITGTIFSVATSGSAQHLFRLDVAGSNVIRLRATDTGSSDALTTNTVAIGTWYFVAGVVSSSTSRAVFLDSQKVTNSTSRSPSGMNRSNVGCSGESSRTNYFDGLISLPTVWNIALTDLEIADLAAGVYPTDIQPSAIVSHWPFDPLNAGEDTVGSNDLTFNGTNSSTDAPPVDPPSSGQTIETGVPVSGTAFFSATVSTVAQITTAAPSAATTFYNPTVSAGAVTITTAAPSAATSFYNATITPGAVSIVTSVPTSETTFPLATVTQVGGTQTITTDAPVSGTQFFNPRVVQQTITIIRGGGSKKKSKKRRTFIVEEERIGSIAVEYTDTLAADLLAQVQAKAREEARKQAEGVQALIHQKTLELRAAREAAEAARQKAERIAQRQAEAFAIWQERQQRLSVARNNLALNRKKRIIRRSERNLQILADLHHIIEIADRYL